MSDSHIVEEVIQAGTQQMVLTPTLDYQKYSTTALDITRAIRLFRDR